MSLFSETEVSSVFETFEKDRQKIWSWKFVMCSTRLKKYVRLCKSSRPLCYSFQKICFILCLFASVILWFLCKKIDQSSGPHGQSLNPPPDLDMAPRSFWMHDIGYCTLLCEWSLNTMTKLDKLRYGWTDKPCFNGDGRACKASPSPFLARRVCSAVSR